ncbi:MAG: acetylxylan esterase, partial [Clostridia bacterium]|nr:acetylxylan esterase [Clostridia bacterium]
TYYKNFKTQANFYEQVEVFVADHAFAEAGTYNLTITPISIPVGSMTIRSVTLDMINYLEPDDVEYSVTHNAAENYKVSDVAVDATTTACMLGAGNCIAWNVTPAYNGHYEIFVNAASVNASLGAYKNELQIGECRFTDSAADASSAKYVSLGEVALFAGESYVIKIESFRKSAAEVYLSDIKLVFRSGFADELIVKDIVILNEDGVRMPHAVIDGATASAQITVYKSGRVNDEIKLFFAQYAQDGALASVASVACDVSEMSDKETGTFAKELVFSGNGGSVRVFMLENGTLKPLYCPIGYEETDIFANVEFPAEVPYKLASEVLDEHNITYDANAYTTTETEDYKIDAIFYDSVVGELTKVFAYLGIPKTASKENPVPAMVLVHGAGGEADIRWVKKWNERGYAAISMDLYGTGPETDDAAVNGQKAHGFGGVLPWGNDGEAFRADFERAGMYQNVINVYNAHTLRLGLDCIAKDKTGISGISYGAVTTTVVSGVDERFKLAAPIYGGGYVDKTKTYFANASFKSFVGTSLAWEPSNFAAKATMPVLYVNNNCDAAFSADTTSWTKGVTPNAYLSLRHGLKHDMGHGMSVEQVYDFAEKIFAGSEQPYVQIEKEKIQDGILTAELTIPSGLAVESVKLYYMDLPELPYNDGSGVENPWTEIESGTIENNILTASVPAGATYAYASVVLYEGSNQFTADEISVSTKLMQVN